MFKNFALAMLLLAGCVGVADSRSPLLTDDMGSGRIVLEVQIVDGVSRPYTYYDTTLSARCFLLPTASGLRCIPSDANLGYYSDAGCTKLGALVVEGCAVPKYGVFTAPACGANRVFTLGTGTKLPNYYILRGATCAPYAVSADHVFYPAVSEIDVSTLAAGVYSH